MSQETIQNIETANQLFTESKFVPIEITTQPLIREDTDFVIYHKNCSDGFGSALAIYTWFKKNYPERLDTITFYPAAHGANPIALNLLADKNVVICDFSYKFNHLVDILRVAKSFMIIDHHKTAEEDLKNVPDKYKVFDMTHSGAYLTWQWYYQCTHEEVPLMIKYIEDRDIWTKKLPNVDDFASILFNTPFDFAEYEKFLNEEELYKAIMKGMIIRNYEMDHIKKMSTSSSVKLYKFNDDTYYFIAYYNSNMYRSDLGNYILTDVHKHADMAAIYSYDELQDKTVFSLRSTDERPDCSEVAKKYGAGGHRCASGMSLPGCKPHIPGTVEDRNNMYYKLLTEGYTLQHSDIRVRYLNHDYYQIRALVQSNPDMNGFNMIKMLQRMNKDCQYIVMYYHKHEVVDNELQTNTGFCVFNDNKEQLENAFNNVKGEITYKKLYTGFGYVEIKGQHNKLF
jgi:nanoRNase/pAp phosphatase (c-di-AMP/oligoRNAs hydrolase)